MAEKHTVAMFVQGEDGRRVQVGWASPKDESGVRTFEYSPGYETTRPKNVSFEDDELSLQVAAEQAQISEGANEEKFEVDSDVDPDATDWYASEEPVELSSGGIITETSEAAETSEEDEEAEFQRLLAEEEAEQAQPQTRRELRESEDD